MSGLFDINEFIKTSRGKALKENLSTILETIETKEKRTPQYCGECYSCLYGSSSKCPELLNTIRLQWSEYGYIDSSSKSDIEEFLQCIKSDNEVQDLEVALNIQKYRSDIKVFSCFHYV